MLRVQENHTIKFSQVVSQLRMTEKHTCENLRIHDFQQKCSAIWDF